MPPHSFAHRLRRRLLRLLGRVDVAALIAQRGFEDLDGPVVRVATPDIPIPFSPPLEQAVLPGVERVKEACRELLAY